ncbi:biotin transporter BioY [Acetonema longum]|uniref:Biotin transporter n=1 Tax=Acetonema longum DSM 6540 TaxID=1009370 RepID=F7NMS5_9FIRM|nr:biotin transporter BioY [Acetonema longum]EGO62667.1 BioY protein [Acetonema longum DSM 6540]
MSIRNMVLAGLFAALLSISSQISFPIGPVPHTLQLFFIMLAGLVLGGRWGAVSVAIWILLGAFGMPVFAQAKSGLPELIGPTGGFKFGFMMCAWLVGRLTERSRLSYPRVGLAMFLGLVVTYVVGLIGFMVSFEYFLGKPMTWDKAWYLAVAPFIPFDAVKAALAAYVGVKIRGALKQAGYSA